MLVKDHVGLIWVGKGSYGLVKDLITVKIKECSFFFTFVNTLPTSTHAKLVFKTL